MPGYRRPQTTAFGPGDVQGFRALEKAFQGAQYTPLDDSALWKNGGFGARRRSVPTTYADIPSSDESSVSAESAEQETAEQRPKTTPTPPHEHLQAGLQSATARLVTPPHLTRENSGLPPTPPTMTNSDHNEPRVDSLATNVQFADAVRNALHTQKSGISTPGRHLPTPETTPPGTSADGSAPPIQSKLLQPLVAHHLRRHPSSRAESFQTARENPTPAPSVKPLTRTPSPESRPAMRQWSTAMDDQPRLNGLGVSVPPVTISHHSTPPPKESESQRSITPTYAGRIKRPVSPYHRRRSSSDDGDWEKHISYISNEDEVIPLKGGLGGLALTVPTDNTTSEQTSAEDLNNAVYRHIQQENVKRHSAMSQLSAVPAGIFFTDAAARDHKLKRAAGHQSLRHVSGSVANIGSARESVEGTPTQLRHKKAQLPNRSLESSPIVEKRQDRQRAAVGVEKTRHVSDPMTKITHAAMGVRVATSPSLGRQQTLRHVSKTARLENPDFFEQPSVRNERTTVKPLEESPRLANAKKAIRHFPRNTLLENSPSVRRASIDEPLRSVSEQHPPQRLTEHKLRHFSANLKLENNKAVRRTSLDTNGSLLPTSPRKSLDARYLYPSTTPVSQSQWSDRSDIEVCEAQGVSIYPHNNESLLVVQHAGSRPSTKDTTTPPAARQLAVDVPVFSARIEEPSPITGLANSVFHADSPLTNPRAAPEPPAIMFIPPTPAEELERELSPDENSRPAVTQRRESLLKRARRFSESFIEQPLFGRSLTVRKPARPSTGNVESRPANLSPMWQPRRLWDDDFDSDSDIEDYDDLDGIPAGRLPPGGDTSSVESRKQRGLFPRNMSVRLPGFRGQGGFLQGNSLGLDRHGTNNRRHYVVRRRSSGGMGSRGLYVTEANRSRELRKRASEEMLKQVAGGRSVFTLPFSGGKKVQYVGIGRFRERMSQIRVEREEKEREKRRQALRGQIQHAKYEGT